MLTDKQKNIMRLVRRSTPVDGWYKVSPQVWPVVDGVLPADLVETKHDDNGHWLRLTSTGEAVMDYLI
jgi:hypothetical protein